MVEVRKDSHLSGRLAHVQYPPRDRMAFVRDPLCARVLLFSMLKDGTAGLELDKEITPPGRLLRSASWTKDPLLAVTGILRKRNGDRSSATWQKFSSGPPPQCHIARSLDRSMRSLATRGPVSVY